MFLWLLAQSCNLRFHFSFERTDRDYLPVDTIVLQRAAELWAKTRKRGLVFADPKALDIDVILAAQANGVANEGHNVIVATTNLKHLSLLTNAQEWHKIVPHNL